MEIDRYQQRAGETDQNPTPSRATMTPDDARAPRRHEVIPLLGVVGEVGGLVEDYKKLLRDGVMYRGFRDEVAEELGDILWYVADLATKFELKLSDVARRNLEKNADRWLPAKPRARLYDDKQEDERGRLPRKFEYRFEQ